MARKISTQSRHELVCAVGERYRQASKPEKLRILDEFVALTGYHRKHSIRLLNASNPQSVVAPRTPRLKLYDAAVREALTVLWEASDRICGKRLKPLLPTLVIALEQHGHLHLDASVRSKLMGVSASTIDRLLAGPRGGLDPRSTRKRPPAVRASIPVRTFDDWKDPLPGFMEADLVSHGGQNVAGSFIHTLTLTDIATGWTECVPLLVRDSALVVEALSQLQTAMPFPLRGFDTDNGSEFINEIVIAFCAKAHVDFTRSRPYRKNDQAWVEQKNGAVVRRLVGYRRLEGVAAAAALNRLYAASRLFVNFFQPSFKLLEKKRIGARVSKKYDVPQTPCARLLLANSVEDGMKEKLRAVAATLDPLRLLDEIRTVQRHIADLAAGEVRHVVAHTDADLESFLKSLATAWQDGEVRPTHRAKQKPCRDWRTRKDPFASVWPQMLLWLQEEPDRTALELLQRVQAEHPGVYAHGSLRTLQRRIRIWRTAAAQKLVFTPPLTQPTQKQNPQPGKEA